MMPLWALVAVVLVVAIVAFIVVTAYLDAVLAWERRRLREAHRARVLAQLQTWFDQLS